MAWSHTGSYDPMAAAAFPVAADVLDSDVAYGPTGAEYAGTYHAPEAAEVISTANFGPASVTPGTYHEPEPGEVISTAVFGPASATPGVFVVPAEADVKDGTNYGVETV